MGRHFSYADPEYKRRQAEITKRYWLLGKFNFKIKPKVELVCQIQDVPNTFTLSLTIPEKENTVLNHAQH